MAKGSQLSSAVKRLQKKFDAELKKLAAKVKAAEKKARKGR
jgi:hypothetical protein